MEFQPGNERRGEVRLHSVNLINYSEVAERRGPTEEEVYSVLGTAATTDMSAGGCRLETQEPLPLGSQLKFALKLAGEIVEFSGVVRHVGDLGEGDYEAGIQFTDLDEVARDGIRVYLSLKAGEEEDAVERLKRRVQELQVRVSELEAELEKVQDTSPATEEDHSRARRLADALLEDVFEDADDARLRETIAAGTFESELHSPLKRAWSDYRRRVKPHVRAERDHWAEALAAAKAAVGGDAGPAS